MYQSSVPVFVHNLTNLSNILKKTAEHAANKKIDESVFVNARLSPDMFPLSRQIQIACDIVKGGCARLAGVEIPSFPDTETTFAELQSRIAKTIEFISSFKADQIDNTEDKAIALKVGGHEMKFDGKSYLLNFVVPNLYFHVMTTYCIVRNNNVDIGKADFLGKIQ